MITGLQADEQRIVSLKYQSKPFGQLNEKELRQSAYNILLEIHVITGWTVPVDELMDILVENTRLKFAESYASVNPDEMKFAFRNYGTQVKDWGKAMNLSLIDEVMIPYLERRRELSQIEEQKQPKMIEHKEDLSDKAMKDWAEDLKDKVKGRQTTVEFMPLMVYDYLIKTGEINPTTQEKNEYLVKAVAYRFSDLTDEKCKEPRELIKNFIRMKDENVFDGEERKKLINLAKRMILYDYLKNRE